MGTSLVSICLGPTKTPARIMPSAISFSSVFCTSQDAENNASCLFPDLKSQPAACTAKDKTQDRSANQVRYCSVARSLFFWWHQSHTRKKLPFSEREDRHCHVPLPASVAQKSCLFLAEFLSESPLPLTVPRLRAAGTCLGNRVVAFFTATSSAFVFCGERDSESRSK